MATTISERLDGRHVLVTGVTGFVGEALLHLILTEVPGLRTTVLVRGKGSTPGAARIATLLKKPIFETVVAAAGGVEALIAARVGVLEGDLSDVPALPTDIDAVIHCAGDVSFDPPVDEGFVANVVGPRELLDRIREVGGDVHYVHVSTAYVAGRRRGAILEGPVEHSVDLEAELAWGLAQRAAVEARSRTTEVLVKERKRAEREHGRAGLITAATAAEEARKTWVKDELVRLGTERARSLGWTDCYTFTKSLGERVVEAYAGEAQPHRVSIVRPSIIESSLERPYPGWIEGFKMAEPLILAYGRGELPETPASADTAVDIVPVDQVVNALVAVLAHPPEPGDVQYFHVTSGDRNALTFSGLYTYVRGYFEEHPFSASERGHAALATWRFPGSASVERALVTGERALKMADYVIERVPRGDRTRDLTRKLELQGRRVRFLRRYFDIYREYVSADLRFSDKNTVALLHSMSAEDQAQFPFDTAVIDWQVYLQEIHIPAVTEPIRRLDEARARRRSPNRSAPRAAASVSATAGQQVAAFFDMDGTLLSSNVIETYLWLRLGELSPGDKVSELGRMASRVPSLVAAERRDRGAFLRGVYKDYSGARLAELEAIADEHLAGHVLSRLAPSAVRRIREHRAAGHLTILITGAVRPLTRSLVPLFDHIEAADLAVDARGVCDGHLASPPLVGESRAAWMRSYAADHGIDLASSFAYADSHSDLPLLSVVGHPVAVRPDVPLYKHARRLHWDIVDWASPTTASRTLDPAGRKA